MGLHFGRYFSQTHLVTLALAAVEEKNRIKKYLVDFRSLLGADF
jgi:hypothetical protein